MTLLQRTLLDRLLVTTQVLLRTWKELSERGDRTGAKVGDVALPGGSGLGKSPVARPSAGGSSGGSGGSGYVLDSVRDENGRVERRVAHPDSHEDQLALSEAAEAERMWEEKMGGGGRGGGETGGRLGEAASQL